MTQTMQVLSPMVGNSLISSPIVQSNRTSFCGRVLARRPQSLTVSQLDSDKLNVSAAESSRRNFMIATAGITAGFTIQPNSAQAAKRKPPPPPEEKKGEDERYLSAYEAKLLANMRRKEELKVLLEAQKKKAKNILQPEEGPLDIFGEVPS